MRDSKQTGMTSATVARRVLRVRGGEAQWRNDGLAAEVPVALSVGDRVRTVMLATPVDLEDFALGFCLSEAIVDSPIQFHGVQVHEHLEGIELALDLAHEAQSRFEERTQSLEGRSGCGLCGAANLEQVVRVPMPVRDDTHIRSDALPVALDALKHAQPVNTVCGAMHAAAWCDTEGSLLCVREDVGRHNALDKLIGAVHRSDTGFAAGFLLLTSRASYEMVMKAATVGIGIVVAISAPTALAVVLAEQSGVTLIGFARADTCVIYSHPERIMNIG